MTILYKHDFIGSGIPDSTDPTTLTPAVDTISGGNFLNFNTGSTHNSRVLKVSGAHYLYTDTASISSANYRVGASVRRIAGQGQEQVFELLGRLTFGSATWYGAQINDTDGTGTAGRVMIFEYPAGTQVGSTHSFTITDNQDYLLELVMDGSTLYALLDGAVVVTTSDATITGAADAGMRFGPNTTGGSTTAGWHVNTFEVNDNVSLGGSIIPLIHYYNQQRRR